MNKARQINKVLKARHNHEKYKKMMHNIASLYSYGDFKLVDVKGRLIPEGIEVFEVKKRIYFDPKDSFQ